MQMSNAEARMIEIAGYLEKIEAKMIESRLSEELQSLPSESYPSGPDPLWTPRPGGRDFDLIRTRNPPFHVQIGSKSGLGGGVRRGSGADW